MALRNLVAKMRNPAAAALRLPSPRVSPPAGARASFYSFAPARNGQHGKRINLESASEVEIRREADLIGKEINETLERLSVIREKVPALWRDIIWSTKLWIFGGAALELALFVDESRRREPEK